MNIGKMTSALVVMVIAFSTACQAQVDSKQDSGNTLEIQRRKIDSLDKALVELLGARQRAVEEIGLYKVAHHIPPLQPARFQEVLRKSIEAGAKEQLSATFITNLMNAIHEESLRIEDSLRTGKSN
jgi:chorismate mutase